MRPLVWFRSDLRVADNPALHAACRDASDGVVALFAVCPQQWAEHDWGAMKVDFVLRSIAALRDELATLKIPLRVLHCPRFADLPANLLELLTETHCDSLYFNLEYEVNERQRDAEVTAACAGRGHAVRSFTDQVVFPPEQLRTKEGGFYSVFSPFRRRWLEMWRETGGAAPLPTPAKRKEAASVSGDDVPTTLPSFTGHTRPDLWPAGSTAALQRLEDFTQRRIAAYKDERDFPAIHGTSTLSPYLAVGAVSVRQGLAAALEVNQNRIDSGKHGVSSWISELIWREFYRHVLTGYPHVCRGRAFRPETEALVWNDNEDAFAAWCAGRTGVPFVDAGMRQLQQTGWLHNRVRMVVAMFLTKDLFIDWRWGERFFMQHLVDGDFASNNGGWQWSASTGTDAAPYFRIFNPVSQGQRFDPDGAYVRKFVDELRELDADAIHAPAAADVDLEALNYPAPIVDHKAARKHAIEAFKALKK